MDRLPVASCIFVAFTTNSLDIESNDECKLTLKALSTRESLIGQIEDGSAEVRIKSLNCSSNLFQWYCIKHSQSTKINCL